MIVYHDDIELFKESIMFFFAMCYFSLLRIETDLEMIHFSICFSGIWKKKKNAHSSKTLKDASN